MNSWFFDCSSLCQWCRILLCTRVQAKAETQASHVLMLKQMTFSRLEFQNGSINPYEVFWWGAKWPAFSGRQYEVHCRLECFRDGSSLEGFRKTRHTHHAKWVQLCCGSTRQTRLASSCYSRLASSRSWQRTMCVQNGEIISDLSRICPSAQFRLIRQSNRIIRFP